MKHYYFSIRPLTAVHIGTGEEFGPLDYTIKEDKYIRFRPESVIASLNPIQMKMFNECNDRNSLKDIAGLLQTNVSDSTSMYLCEATGAFIESFKKNSTRDENQQLVGAMYRSGSTAVPVIPGSSLKGAIRTAYMSVESESIQDSSRLLDKKYDNKAKCEKDVPKSKYDQIILNYNDAKNDPFRAVHISDASILGTANQLVSELANFKERRKNGNASFSKMAIIKEMIRGEFLDGDAEGLISLDIDEQLQQESPIEKWEGINVKIVAETMLKNCNKFYQKNFNDEYKKFYEGSDYAGNEFSELIKLKDVVNSLKANECLVRVGQFSQAENVTIERHRRPKNDKGFGNTRTLVSYKGKYYPVGWVILSILDEKDYHERKMKEEEYLRSLQSEKFTRKTSTAIVAPSKSFSEISKEVAAVSHAEEISESDQMLLKISKLTKENAGSMITPEFIEQHKDKDLMKVVKRKLEEIGLWEDKKGKWTSKKEAIDSIING